MSIVFQSFLSSPHENRKTLQRTIPSILFLIICLGLTVSSWAQKDTGSIVGTVTDSTGAVIPAAKVT